MNDDKVLRLLDGMSAMCREALTPVSLAKQTEDENKFKPGDIVTMVTGSPKMIVDMVSRGGAYCNWFDWLRGKKMRDYFLDETLKHE